MSFDLNTISTSLRETTQGNKNDGITFSGRSLKLNNEDDAKEVITAIEQCKNMEFLDLEGNTLGPDAAKGISKAIERNGKNLKRALWKDMFTGRMKDEIPVALEHFGRGLCIAKTCLFELDLSDNAFGPIGIDGLATLLSSSPCYTLQELKLNNNGLGISGGRILAKALLDCHKNSLKEISKPFALKVFVAGRNRLENEGATALAIVFENLRSLEEVVMPQNGIYHAGITALADALSVNHGLRILNLNDNTVGPKGAKALAKVLLELSLLERLNLGDCLLKTEGAIVLANSLGVEGKHPLFTELNLSFNEIKAPAIIPIVKAMADKTHLTCLALDGNAFGKNGKDDLIKLLHNSGKREYLGSLDEDEGDDDENEDSDKEEDSENEDEIEDNRSIDEMMKPTIKVVTVEEFLEVPTAENFLSIKGDRTQAFTEYIENLTTFESENQVHDAIQVITKVSALCSSGYMDVRIPTEQVTERLYLEIFTNAMKNKRLSSVNNALLVSLGLIKGEEKNSSNTQCNPEGCFRALEKICQKDYFPSLTRETLKLFIENPMKISESQEVDSYQEAKKKLEVALDQELQM